MTKTRLLLSLSLMVWSAAAVGQDVIHLQRIATGMARPVFVTQPPADNSRLFIVEQHTGRIRILNTADNTINGTPFLTVPGISTGNEQGLLGLAFHPDYANNGYFYVNYTDNAGGAVHVRRYQASGNPATSNVANAATFMEVITFSHPQSNHNGGWIAFNPKINQTDPQYLYIASGDGGNANDQGTGHTEPGGNAQDTTSNPLGKMLRLDVTTDPTRNYTIPPTNPFVGNANDDEIWAYGLRNPWRNSFDRQTGDLYIGDVGQGAREEVNFQPANSPGGVNYGWRLREGTIQTPGGVGGARPAGAVDPIHEYNHDGTGGFSITGGYMYRGPVTALQGHYFFADYVSDRVWSFQYDGVNKTNFQVRTNQFQPSAGAANNISSFSEDNQGNMYVVSLDGDVFRVASMLTTAAAASAEDQAGATLFPFGSSWRYLDNGSNQGTAWRDTGFNDGGWAQGNGQFGYGDGDETTTVDCSNLPDCITNNHITTYFRKSFRVDDPTAYSQVYLGVVRDDGVAVYINGTEVARTPNLAPNAAFNTLANLNGAVAIGNNDELPVVGFTVNPSSLESGNNVFAAEMHQQAVNSSDISFDMRLSVALRTVPGDTDFDGDVDGRDVANMAQHLGATSPPLWSQGNFNNDGLVSLLDLVALQRNFGVTPSPSAAAVPEPTTAWLATLLVLGAGAWRHRFAR